MNFVTVGAWGFQVLDNPNQQPPKGTLKFERPGKPFSGSRWPLLKYMESLEAVLRPTEN